MSVREDRWSLLGSSAIAVLAFATACGSSGGTTGTPARNPDAGDRSVDGGTSGGGGTVDVPIPPTAGTFVENFTWSGTHAAVINGGKGTSVWFNADAWDVTGDTHAIAIMGEWDDKPSPNEAGGTTNTNSGHFVYVQKAASGCDASATAPCTGITDDTALVPGGDKSPGVAVFGLDEQDIVGARLRTPIAISESAPGIIRLRAPRFVTDGGWWELALTPADRAIGGENTVIESQGLQDGLGDVGDTANSAGKGAGPGHDPQEESFNVVFTGVTDFACETNAGLEGSMMRVAVKSLVKGGSKGGYKTATGERFNAWNPKSIWNAEFHGTYQQDLIRPGLDGTKEVEASMLNKDGSENTAKVAAANIADVDNLYLWQIEFRPSGVDVKADFNDGRGLALVEHLKLGVPWTTAYAHFMAVAYQNDHHPQVETDCPFLPIPYTRRDLRFRTLSIGPVLYSTTSIFPPDGAPTDANGNVLLCDGGKSCGSWMQYDMRDTHNFGAPDTVAGKTLKKANAEKFSFPSDYVHGSTGHFGGGRPAETSFDLYVPVSDDLTKAKAANFVYNVLGAKGVANLLVNGHMVGALLTADTVIGASVKNDVATEAGCPDYDCMSVRRSIPIDPDVLRQDTANGMAHLQVMFDQAHLGSGTFIDRIQLEMMH
jgi:hypothetical protein